MTAVTAIVLLLLAGLLAGGFVGTALAAWKPAFPTLFLAGVTVFLVWSGLEAWSGSDDDTVGALAGFFALVGWIAGITAGIGVRRQQRRRALRA